ncbi:MAG: hypothetical protein K1Y02_04750 [Candidatus Hydrogenedentes bacterium]|nr:hypothetical protein [Candidatus Hydrogenedentota bacterium]
MMGTSRLFTVWVAALAVAGACHAASLKIQDDRMAEVDGKRTFILGLYGAPKGDSSLDQAAAAGFNLINAQPDKGQLDTLQAKGVWGWINTGAAIDFSEAREDREQQLRKLVTDFGGHPAMLVWEVPDEALWNVWYGANQWRMGAERSQLKQAIDALTDAELQKKLLADRDRAGQLYGEGKYAEAEQVTDSIWKALGKEQPQPGLNLSNAPERATKMANGMIEGYKLLREIDTNHPVWMNHAPRNTIEQLAEFNRGADIVGCDIYPVPARVGGHSDLMDVTVTSVGGYTKRMQDAAPGKPTWMVLQGFGWADLGETKSDPKRDEFRRPTFDESRFMAYDAIANGARGILYWGSAYIEADSQLWADLQKLVRELADRQPLLSAREATLPIRVTTAQTWGSQDRTIRIVPKQVGDTVSFIVVNEWREPLTYTIAGLESLNGVTYSDGPDITATVTNGSLTQTIKGQSVHVLEPGAK